MTRKERLKKLVTVQEKLKAFHEMRHAAFRADAIAAQNEAASLRAGFDEPGSMSSLFPEVYHRRIERALERAARSLHLAEQEIAHVATQTVRTGMVERAYRSASREEERVRSERELLDLIARAGSGEPD